MKSAGEPNLRRIDERLHAARKRATDWIGQWHADGCAIILADGSTLNCRGEELARHIADCHNYFLSLTNQLLYRERSEEDLHEPGPATREIPRTAGTRRFPIPPSRPRPAGTP